MTPECIVNVPRQPKLAADRVTGAVVTGSTADIFVSYKAEDRRRVKPLVEGLETDGFSVWWDEQIGGGEGWRESIQRHLDEAKCVIVVWSKRSIGPHGEFVRDEATRALRRHTYLPVRIDNVEPPLGFGETQAVSLTAWRGDRSDGRYQAVLEAARAIISGRPRPSLHFESPGLTRRTVVAGVAAATVAAGIGGWILLKPSSARAARSIAVLPFANLSGDPTQSYFSDGVAEEIRNALARIAGLTVIGRTSSEAVRNEDAATAAKKLGVANILTGSVRESASTIRINAELVDGRTGIDRWSQDYDRAPGDAIKIQTDIAENVAVALSAALGTVARAAIAIGGTSVAAAQDFYLKARAQFLASDNEQSVRASLQLLDSAIALDARFASAYAFKAMLMAELTGYFGKSGEFASGFAKAAAVAQKAIALAPDLAAGHMAMGRILANELNFKGSVAEFAKANSLSSDVNNLSIYSTFLGTLGDTDKAVELAQRAQTGDPLNPVFYQREANILFSGRRYADSLHLARKAVELAPNFEQSRAIIGASLMQMGKAGEAIAELRKTSPDALSRLVPEAILFARQGNKTASDAAIAWIQKLYGDAANYQIAEIYAQRGEKDRAFATLDRAWGLRDPGLEALKADPYLDPLRGDQRFATLVRKLRFP